LHGPKHFQDRCSTRRNFARRYTRSFHTRYRHRQHQYPLPCGLAKAIPRWGPLREQLEQLLGPRKKPPLGWLSDGSSEIIRAAPMPRRARSPPRRPTEWKLAKLRAMPAVKSGSLLDGRRSGSPLLCSIRQPQTENALAWLSLRICEKKTEHFLRCVWPLRISA
jgi:hypothetical protein